MSETNPQFSDAVIRKARLRVWAVGMIWHFIAFLSSFVIGGLLDDNIKFDIILFVMAFVILSCILLLLCSSGFGSQFAQRPLFAGNQTMLEIGIISFVSTLPYLIALVYITIADRGFGYNMVHFVILILLIVTCIGSLFSAGLISLAAHKPYAAWQTAQLRKSKSTTAKDDYRRSDDKPQFPTSLRFAANIWGVIASIFCGTSFLIALGWVNWLEN